MRYTTPIATLVAFAMSAQAAVVQTSVLSSGALNIWKNSIGAPGQQIRLTFDAAGALVASTDGSQSLYSFNAVDNSTIVFPGTSEVVVTKGRIGDSTGKTCLTRDAASGALALKPCVADDAGAEAQLWQTSLVYHENDEATGIDREIAPYKKGTFSHLAGGKVYQAASKPPSKWFLTFSYIE